MSPLAFVAAILLYLLAQFTSTLRWKLLLPRMLGIRKLFSLYMIGSFFNTFLPGLIGGDAVKGFYLYKETGKGSLTLASIFMDRYIGFVVTDCNMCHRLPFRIQISSGFAYRMAFTCHGLIFRRRKLSRFLVSALEKV